MIASLSDLISLPDWLRLGSRQFVAVAVVTGIILFGPDAWIEPLGLLDLRGELRPYLGGAFLLSATLALVNASAGIWNWGHKKYQGYKAKKAGKKRLHNLTSREKKILRGYIIQETRSLKIRVTNKTVHGLVQAGILYQASSIGSMLEGHPFNIREWAWEYLHEHPELLE